MNPLAEFLASDRHNAWLHYPDKEVYVRKGHHYHKVKDKVLHCLDVANISVNKPHTGVFTAWLAEIKTLLQGSDFDAIYVESVINDSFAAYLLRHGWYECTRCESRSFFMLLH